MRLHLLDATYELFRAYFAMPSMSAPDGLEVGGVRGLMGSVLRLLTRPEVTHLGCASDHVIESWRNEHLDTYKTGEGMEPEIKAQIPLMEEGLRALGCVVWPMVRYEADDAIGTAVHRFGPDFEQIIICSPDKDFAQLVDGDRVTLYDRRKAEARNEAGVLEKFGVPPASIPDYLALVGDSADGIPGINAWGAKSTATVLRTYARLEDIPDDPTEWTMKVRGAKRLAGNLAANRKAAELYKRLTTISLDAPITESAEDLRWRGPDPEAIRAFAARIGDKRLAQRAIEATPAL